MIGKILATTVVTSTLLFATQASAGLADFNAYADANGEASVGEAKAGSYANPLPTDENVTISGLVLTATSNNGADVAYAYLDAGNAGLGVCKTTTSPGAQCDPSSDDNVTDGETLMIALDDGALFSINVTEFRDAGHGDITNSSDQLMIDIGGGFFTTTFDDVSDTTYTGLSFIKFAFGGDPADQFYLSSIDISRIPEPAALALFLVGLFGLGLAVRRRHKFNA